MPRKIGRTCNVCNEFMEGGESDFIRHGLEQHPTHFYNGTHSKYYFKEKNYFCPIDNNWYESRKWMARAIPKTGSGTMTNEEYYLKYGQQHMPNEWAANTNDLLYGDAKNRNTCLECRKPVKFDEGHWEYPVFCANSKCNVNWHNAHGRSDRAKNTMTVLRAEDPLFCLNPTQILYWTNKGFSEDQAKEMVKERQAVGTLEKFIERADGDVEKGTEAWKKRQEKWFESLRKSGMYSGYSKKSETLFDAVQNLLPYHYLEYGKNERSIRCGSKVVKPDCYNHKNKKIIEFNGDYWHGNPEKYKNGDVIKSKTTMTVEQKWADDAERKTNLESLGFQVLVLWESEYTENPAAVIDKCVDFLKV